jgi:hypothetical protein
MRALIATKYVTLDGVMEAPGEEQSLGPRGSPMGKGIYDISMALDGFIAGANVRPEVGWAGLGDGGERLHDWGFTSANPRNREIAEVWASGGAISVGRTRLVNR